MRDSHSNHKEAGGEAWHVPFQLGSELALKSLQNAALKTKATLYGVVPGQMIILEEPVFNLNERLSGLSEDFACGYIRGNYLYTFKSRFIKNLLPNVICAEYPWEVKRIQIRASTRIPVNIEVEVVLGAKFGSVSGRMEDISETGCRVRLPGPVLMPKGSKFHLSFILPDDQQVEDILCTVMNFRHYQDVKATAVGVSFRGPERNMQKVQKFCRSVLCSLTHAEIYL